MVIAPKLLFEHNNFAGGLNTQYSPFQLNDNESPDCQNVLFDSKGTIKKIKGFSKANTVEIVADKGIYGLIPYYRYTDDTRRLIAMCDTQLWKWTGGASFTSIKIGLTANEMIQGTTFMDLCLIVKKSDNPMTYDGTDVEDLGGSPSKGQYITHHVRRIFISGNTSYPNRIYYSDAGDYAIWGVNSYIDVEPIKGDTISGINVVLDSVIIYTQNCIFVIDTQDSSVVTDWVVKRVSTDVGCVAPYTLETIKENTVFLSNLGVYTLGGVLAKEAYDFDQIKTGLLSDKITNYIKEFNQANIDKSCNISFDYKLWLSGPYGSDTTNSRIVVYDFINNCWSRIKGINASCFALYRVTDGEDLYFGSPTEGYVYKYGEVDNFDGAVIESWYETKPFSLENPGQLKRYWRYQVLVGNTGDHNLTVGYSVDFNASFENSNINLMLDTSLWDQAKWDVDIWDASKSIIIRPVTMKGERGRYISFRFENSQADQYYEIYALLLKFSVKMFMKGRGE